MRKPAAPREEGGNGGESPFCMAPAVFFPLESAPEHVALPDAQGKAFEPTTQAELVSVTRCRRKSLSFVAFLDPKAGEDFQRFEVLGPVSLEVGKNPYCYLIIATKSHRWPENFHHYKVNRPFFCPSVRLSEVTRSDIKPLGLIYPVYTYVSDQ